MTRAPAVELAVGQSIERVTEIEGRVSQHESKVEFLVDRHGRADSVGSHANSDDDDPGEKGRRGDDVVEHPGDADAFEDDGPPRAEAELLDAPKDVGPRDRQPLQTFHRVHRQFRTLRDGPDHRCAERRRHRGNDFPDRPPRPPRGRRPARADGPTGRWRHTIRTPAALRTLTTARPIGPQPTTMAGVRLDISARRTACRATAIGSVRTAATAGRPFGTGSINDSSTRTSSA